MICGVFLAGRLIPGRQAILFNITGIVTEEVCNQKYNNTLGWKGKLCEKH